MSAEIDLIKLYSGRILALAADIPRLGRLDAPDASASLRAPLCGSSVTVDVQVRDGVLVDMGQEVKACALGQAAASVVGAAAPGCSFAQIKAARSQLGAMLEGSGGAPEAPFEALEVLTPAVGYKNRHASIMLALDATVEAMQRAMAQSETL